VPKPKFQDLVSYLYLSRPFTLLAPAIGIISGAVVGCGASGGGGFRWSVLPDIALGAFSAAVLNAASNTINQIFDIENDRINRPLRPLPSGRLTVRQAAVFACLLYGVGLGAAWFVNGAGHWFFAIALTAAVVTLLYSAPPLRLKRWWLTANLAIALTRGALLVVAGWTTVRAPSELEPWFLGAMMGVFIFGAATSKDYADVEGDRRAGCVTLPVRFGARGASRIVAPFYIVPFLLIPIGAKLGVLTGNPRVLGVIWLIFLAAGAAVAALGIAEAGEKKRGVWVGTYLLMMVIQVGLIVAYTV